jgi:hypothetical protein
MKRHVIAALSNSLFPDATPGTCKVGVPHLRDSYSQDFRPIGVKLTTSHTVGSRSICYCAPHNAGASESSVLPLDHLLTGLIGVIAVVFEREFRTPADIKVTGTAIYTGAEGDTKFLMCRRPLAELWLARAPCRSGVSDHDPCDNGTTTIKERSLSQWPTLSETEALTGLPRV